MCVGVSPAAFSGSNTDLDNWVYCLLWLGFFKTSGEEEGTRKELRVCIIEILE